MDLFRRVLPWMLRAVWALLPLACGPSMSAALDGVAIPARTLCSVVLWGGWATALCATLVPRAVGLTVLRTAAPAALAASVAAGVAGHASAVGIAASAAAAMITLAPETGEWFVNGAAYVNERRFPLKVPGPLLVGPLQLAWILAVGAPLAGGLLLAHSRWASGILVLAFAIPLSVVLIRALHGLARRWIVLVPAGLVVHDPMTLADPVLIRAREIASIGPAPPQVESVDLTQRALGLALVVVLKEAASIPLREGRGRIGRTVDSTSVLVSPTRPGAVLRAARARRLPTA